jgi:hypothetical protein
MTAASFWHVCGPFVEEMIAVGWPYTLTAARLADLIGRPVTRNMIASFCRKKGLRAMGTPGMLREGLPDRLREPIRPPVPVEAPEPEPLPPMAPPTPPAEGVTIMELTPYSCRYPLWAWEEKSGNYCGKLAADGPYCDEHAKRCGGGP